MSSSKDVILNLRHKIVAIEPPKESFTNKMIYDFNQQKLIDLKNELEKELNKTELEYFSIWLNGKGVGNGRAPVKKIAEFLNSLQSIIENIGQSISVGPKERGRISHEVQFNNEITLEAMTSGSVRLELSANTHLNMFSNDNVVRKDSVVVRSLDTFFDVLGETDPNETVDKLVPLGNNVLRSFSTFLRTAINNDLQVKSSWLDLDGKINSRQLTYEYANMTLLKIDQLDDMAIEEVKLEGKVVNINFEKNKIAFRPDDPMIKEFTCFWSDDLKPQFYADGTYFVPAYIQGLFQKETKKNIATGNEKIYWSLLSLEKIVKEQ